MLVYDSLGTCLGCHRCLKKDVIITITYCNTDHTLSSHQSPKATSDGGGHCSSPSCVLSAKRRKVDMIMVEAEADESGHAALLPPFTRTCSKYDIKNDDEYEDEETDRCSHATPLPPDSYSPQEMSHSFANIS